MKKISFIICLVVLCLFAPNKTLVYSQDHKTKHSYLIQKNIQETNNNGNSLLKGQLIDLNTNQPIPFAQIRLQNSMMSSESTSDIKGNFEFLKLMEGTYTIFSSYVGYMEFSNDSIFVEKNKITILKIGMAPNKTSIIEVKE
jgi:hypothetical protein